MAIDHLQDWDYGLDKVLADAMVGLSLLGNVVTVGWLSFIMNRMVKN